MGAGPIRPPEPANPALARESEAHPHSQSAHAPEPKQPVPSTVDSQEIKTHWDPDNGVVVEITDQQSGQLVRQIPSQQVLNVAHSIELYLRGNAASPAKDQIGPEVKHD